MNTHRKLSEEVTSILDAVRGLPDENIMDARELLEHDEWGEALSLICTQLYEYEVPLDSELYSRIEEAGNKMGMSSEGWEMLRELI